MDIPRYGKHPGRHYEYLVAKNLHTGIASLIKDQKDHYPDCIHYLPKDEFGVIRQFKVFNANNGWCIHEPNDVAVFQGMSLINKRMHLYIATYNEPASGPVNKGGPTTTAAQLSRMNMQSVYRYGINCIGAMGCIGFILEDFYKFDSLDAISGDPEMLKKFILNVRAIAHNYITFLYPEFNVQPPVVAYSNVLAASVLRILGVPITPQNFADATNCTLPVAEVIFDKYDPVADEFDGIPWAVV